MDKDIKLLAQYQGIYLDIYLDSQTLTARANDQFIPTHRLTGFQDFQTCRNIATLENCWFQLINSTDGLVLIKSPCMRGGVQFGSLNVEQTEIAVKEKLAGKTSREIASVLSLEPRLIDDALAAWEENLKLKRASGERVCICGLKTPEIVCVCEQKFTILCQVCCDAHIRHSSLPIHPFEPIRMLDNPNLSESSGILKFLKRKEKIDYLHFAALRIIHRIKLFKFQVDALPLSNEKKAELFSKSELIMSKYEKLIHEFNEIRYDDRLILSSNAKELLIAIKRKRPDTVAKELEISLKLRMHSAPNKISNNPSASISYNLSDFAKTLYTIDTSANLWDSEAYTMVKRSHVLPEEFKGYVIPPSVCTLPSDFAFYSGGHKNSVSAVCGIINTSKMIIKKLPNMDVPRYDHCLVYFEGDIYAFGGNDGNNNLTSVEAFNLKAGVWRRVSDMPNPRSKFAACIIDDKIWLAGGIGTTEIDIFNTTEQVYSKLNNPVPLQDASTLISDIGDKYIIIQAGVVQYYYPESEITEPAGSISDTSPVVSSRALVHSGRLLWVNHENKFQILKLNGPMESSLSSS